jgi:serine protease Do
MRKHDLPILALLAAMFALPAFVSTQAQVITTPRVYVSRTTGTWIGVSVLDVTEDRVKDLKLKDEHGVEVVTVAPDGPAQKAGLKEHDVVLEYNGTRVESVEQFKRMVSETPAGRAVKLQISRDGAMQTFSVKLEERTSTSRRGSDGNSWAFAMPPAPPTPPSPPSTPRAPRAPRVLGPEWNLDLGDLFNGMGIWGNTPRLGIEGEEISGQLAEYFGVLDKTGVLVRDVAAGSAAEKAGLKAGDVITKVDGKRVSDMRDLWEIVRDSAGKSFQVVVVRNKKETTLSVRVEKVEMRQADHV